MLAIFFRIWGILNPRDKAYFFLLLAMMALGALLEVVGIGLLVPLVAMVQDPEPFLKNPFIGRVYQLSGIASLREFLMAACAAVLCLFFFKNVYQVFLIWVQNRFLYGRYVRKSRQMFQLYLQRPYAFHLRQNTAQLLRNMQLVQPSITSVLLPFLFLATDAMTIIAIVVLLLWVDPFTSLTALLGLGGVVGVTYWVIRRRVGILGHNMTRELTGMIQQIQQALGSMKETRVLCREDYFLKQFTSHLIPFSTASRFNSFITQLPRYINETAVMAFVLVLLMLAIATHRGTEAFLTLGLFAVATIRLLPSLSRIGGSLSSIRFYSANLNEIYPDLVESKNLTKQTTERADSPRRPLSRELRFEEVCFQYEGASVPALHNISLVIQANQSVAFVGPSGAGKTTAADLLLGLYTPTSGRITVDGEDIITNLRSWQRNIGYVPQQIFLSDASIRENVAFGLETEVIDDAAVLRALRMAQLEEFVLKLPDGLSTPVGERGTRLSGGQRQRIGIARALYHDPDVLVLDEATAALDNETEAAFIESVRELAGKKTMILIAHRLTTIEHCDTVFYLSNGRLAGKGAFQQLLQENHDFARMARRPPLSD